MLTELIAAHQEQADPNGNGHLALAEDVTEAEDDDADEELRARDRGRGRGGRGAGGHGRRPRRRAPLSLPPSDGLGQDDRRCWVRRGRTHAHVLILTHRRLLVSQFVRDLTDEGYGDRLTPAVERGSRPTRRNPLTIQTYAWFARHWNDLNRDAYQLVIADEAHTALGEKTSQAIRSFPDPIYVGMTATEQFLAKQVSDVFPASVDDLPLADARRGLIAPYGRSASRPRPR